MALLVETATGEEHLLEAEHFVGRGLNCSLCINARYVSAQHALVRWNGDHWEVKDLGSRNGTFVDGIRVRAGEEAAVRVGSRLAFGKAEQEWHVTDATAPTPMAVPLDGGEPIHGQHDLIALPSAEDPRITIYRNTEGDWVLEHSNEASSPIAALQTFEIDGRKFRFSCPQTIIKTSISHAAGEGEVRNIHLRFGVSRDEEHVQLHVTCAGKTHDLGARSRHYLLLTLARRRLEDIAQGIPEPGCGWIDQQELARDPSMAGPQLNIDVFRIRKQFGELNLADPANIIERRPRTRQLRVGTAHLAVLKE